MHIPTVETQKIELLSFEDALSEEDKSTPAYDRNRWLYVP
jgi:hypothetical protein